MPAVEHANSLGEGLRTVEQVQREGQGEQQSEGERELLQQYGSRTCTANMEDAEMCFWSSLRTLVPCRGHDNQYRLETCGCTHG
jgi:hypothetical protein